MPSVFLKIFLKELVVYGYGTNSYYSFLGLGTTYIIFYPPIGADFRIRASNWLPTTLQGECTYVIIEVWRYPAYPESKRIRSLEFIIEINLNVVFVFSFLKFAI